MIATVFKKFTNNIRVHQLTGKLAESIGYGDISVARLKQDGDGYTSEGYGQIHGDKVEHQDMHRCAGLLGFEQHHPVESVESYPQYADYKQRGDADGHLAGGQ